MQDGCFKFQSDSINTRAYEILWCSKCNFKFQSDSINTIYDDNASHSDGFFKFQSDSINTGNEVVAGEAHLTLNSNLILLIPGHTGSAHIAADDL